MIKLALTSLRLVPPLIAKRAFRNCLWEGPAGCGMVALTFDDGPDPEVTPAVLDALLTFRGLLSAGKPGLMLVFPIAELIHIPYLIVVTLRGLFGTYMWRGRLASASGLNSAAPGMNEKYCRRDAGKTQ